VEGIKNSVLKILEEQNTLFDDLIKNVENHADLNLLLDALLVEGKIIEYNIDDPTAKCK
jgi:hypothetical protein